MKTNQTKFDSYQMATDQIVELLEKGLIPWNKPWGLDETGKSPDVFNNTCFKKRKTFKVNPLHLNGEKSLDRLEELEAQIEIYKGKENLTETEKTYLEALQEEAEVLSNCL